MPPQTPEVDEATREAEASQEAEAHLYSKFHTTVMASRPSAPDTGNSDLDLLLRKGLYGDKLPQKLKGQRAADAFQSAFDLIGGIPRLALWADKNPSAFFALYSKLIPATVQAQVNHTIKIDAPWMNPNRLGYQDAIDVTPPAPSGTRNTSEDRGRD